MSDTKATTFFVLGAPVSYLVACFHERMSRRMIRLSLPSNHTAEIIRLSEWKASRSLPN
jgi:hypothetical protein